jgi:hypothetical protein
MIMEANYIAKATGKNVFFTLSAVMISGTMKLVIIVEN